MADFEVPVVKIERVESHPDADRLSLVYVLGYTCIAQKNEDGSHKYKEGELVVYIPEMSVLPEWLMKEMDFWDPNKNKPSFRYVKPKKLRGIFSQGILYPLSPVLDFNMWGLHVKDDNLPCTYVKEGDDVATFLEITKWEPVVPAQMRGQMSGEYVQYAKVSDCDSIQKLINIFDLEEDVIVTEKIHGTQSIITWVPKLNDPKLFGVDGNIFVTSKGIGKKGFVLKNIKENDDNIYVKTLRKLLEQGLEEKLKIVNEIVGGVETLHIIGEIFGLGVQDLGYAQKEPKLMIFDVAINQRFVDYYKMLWISQHLGLETVPWLYEGPFDLSLIEHFRDGKDTISGSHIREGIVIRSKIEGHHPKHGRKIVKWVSPDYLLRKYGTEYS